MKVLEFSTNVMAWSYEALINREFHYVSNSFQASLMLYEANLPVIV